MSSSPTRASHIAAGAEGGLPPVSFLAPLPPLPPVIIATLSSPAASRRPLSLSGFLASSSVNVAESAAQTAGAADVLLPPSYGTATAASIAHGCEAGLLAPFAPGDGSHNAAPDSEAFDIALPSRADVHTVAEELELLAAETIDRHRDLDAFFKTLTTYLSEQGLDVQNFPHVVGRQSARTRTADGPDAEGAVSALASAAATTTSSNVAGEEKESLRGPFSAPLPSLGGASAFLETSFATPLAVNEQPGAGESHLTAADDVSEDTNSNRDKSDINPLLLDKKHENTSENAAPEEFEKEKKVNNQSLKRSAEDAGINSDATESFKKSRVNESEMSSCDVKIDASVSPKISSGKLVFQEAGLQKLDIIEGTRNEVLKTPALDEENKVPTSEQAVFIDAVAEKSSSNQLPLEAAVVLETNSTTAQVPIQQTRVVPPHCDDETVVFYENERKFYYKNFVGENAHYEILKGEDYSKVQKITSQTPISTFWAFVDPWIRPITKRDLNSLEPSSYAVIAPYLTMPALGTLRTDNGPAFEGSHYASNISNRMHDIALGDRGKNSSQRNSSQSQSSFHSRLSGNFSGTNSKLNYNHSASNRGTSALAFDSRHTVISGLHPNSAVALDPHSVEAWTESQAGQNAENLDGGSSHLLSTSGLSTRLLSALLVKTKFKVENCNNEAITAETEVCDPKPECFSEYTQPQLNPEPSSPKIVFGSSAVETASSGPECPSVSFNNPKEPLDVKSSEQHSKTIILPQGKSEMKIRPLKIIIKHDFKSAGESASQVQYSVQIPERTLTISNDTEPIADPKSESAEIKTETRLNNNDETLNSKALEENLESQVSNAPLEAEKNICSESLEEASEFSSKAGVEIQSPVTNDKAEISETKTISDKDGDQSEVDKAVDTEESVEEARPSTSGKQSQMTMAVENRKKEARQKIPECLVDLICDDDSFDSNLFEDDYLADCISPHSFEENENGLRTGHEGDITFGSVVRSRSGSPNLDLSAESLDTRLGSTINNLLIFEGRNAVVANESDAVSATLRKYQQLLLKQREINNERKKRLLKVAMEYIGFQEYNELLDEIDKPLEKAFISRYGPKPQRKQKRRSGAANNSSFYSGYNGTSGASTLGSTATGGLASAANASGTGSSALSVQGLNDAFAAHQSVLPDSIMQLLNRRRLLISTLGSAFSGREKDFFTIPKSTVYEDIPDNVLSDPDEARIFDSLQDNKAA